MIFTDTVVVVRPVVTRDRWDNDTVDWATATRSTVTGVAVLPSTQIEDATGVRIALSSGWRLYSKPGMDVDLSANDRVEWGGMSLEVIGDVARWPHPIRAGHVHHIEAELRRFSG